MLFVCSNEYFLQKFDLNQVYVILIDYLLKRFMFYVDMLVGVSRYEEHS